jgi:hypothetical protein
MLPDGVPAPTSEKDILMKRCMARGGLVLGLMLAVSTANGCGGTTAAAASPSAVLSTDSFTGTISPLGAASHTFTVNYSGAYTNASLTVTSLTTVASAAAQAITVGVGFGTSNLGVCTRSSTYTNPAAPLNTELPTTGSPFIAGVYCVQVFDNPDSSTVTEPLNYAITVKHY